MSENIDEMIDKVAEGENASNVIKQGDNPKDENPKGKGKKKDFLGRKKTGKNKSGEDINAETEDEFLNDLTDEGGDKEDDKDKAGVGHKAGLGKPSSESRKGKKEAHTPGASRKKKNKDGSEEDDAFLPGFSDDELESEMDMDDE